MSIMQSSRNGTLLWSNGEVGRDRSNVDEVTCTYTAEGGDVYVVIGVFTDH